MKCKILFAALLLPITAMCQTAPAISPVSAGPHMFRGNPEHTGVYDALGVPQFHNVKWKFHTQGYVISSPVIDGRFAYVGSTDGNLYAVDIASGVQKWKFKTGARITSSPAIANGIVYVGSYDSKFYAVDAASGALKWKFQTAGEHRFTAKHIHGSVPGAEAMPDPFDFYLSSPTLVCSAVFL